MCLRAEFGSGECVAVKIGEVQIAADAVCDISFLVLLMRRDRLYIAVVKARANNEPVSNEELHNFATVAVFHAALLSHTNWAEEPSHYSLNPKTHSLFSVAACGAAFVQSSQGLPVRLGLLAHASTHFVSPEDAIRRRPVAVRNRQSLKSVIGPPTTRSTVAPAVQLGLGFGECHFASASPVLGFDISSSPLDKVFVLTADRQIHHLSLLRTPNTRLLNSPTEPIYSATYAAEQSVAFFIATRDMPDFYDRTVFSHFFKFILSKGVNVLYIYVFVMIS